MATLKDLSAHLGLSVTQVSRALNGYSDVSADTRQRVLDAAKELNYQPNLSARKLARGRSGMVAIVRRYFSEITRDTTFLEGVTGLSLEFSKRNMQLVLHVAPRENDSVELHRQLYAGGAIDGFVLLEPILNDPRITYLQAENIPFVVHGRTEDNPNYPFVDIDNVAVGYELTKHLIAAGHRKILFLNGFKDRGYSYHREKGYRQALAEAGIEVDDALIINERMNEEFGYEAIKSRFANDKPATAILSGHMRISDGVMQALDELGLSVPHDVSLVSHDDVMEGLDSARFNPPLTVSRGAIRDSWGPLGDFMEQAVRGVEFSELQEIQKIELIERQSVAPPRL